ncbi:MAG: pyridoxamine 5'-phosphate oxidase family protein [Pseudomonadota bacterium]
MRHPSSRPTTIRARQNPDRASYEREDIHRILDAGYFAHLAFVHDGMPVNTPMMYWRDGDYVYWHGSTKSRAMTASEGDPVCIAVTHFDGLVFAKSAFHHSANYRSVMIFGNAESAPDIRKTEQLHALMERIAPGRDATLRPLRDNELRATKILRIPLDCVSAKVRSGPPVEDPRDVDWEVWTGVVPCKTQFTKPVGAGDGDNDLGAPEIG